MAKTKQTARKMDVQPRQEGLEAAVVVPPTHQEGEDIQEQEAEETVGTGEQPSQEQVDTSKYPEDPTGPLEASAAPIPSTSAGTGTAEITTYMTKCQGFAKTWIEEVVEKKEQAYRDLIAGLIGLVREQNKVRDLKVGVDNLDEGDIKAVLDSIPDMSGKYVDDIGRTQVEVYKEQEEITRKRFTEQKKATEQQAALNEYYQAAKDLCQSQKIFMAKLESDGQS